MKTNDTVYDLDVLQSKLYTLHQRGGIVIAPAIDIHAVADAERIQDFLSARGITSNEIIGEFVVIDRRQNVKLHDQVRALIVLKGRGMDADRLLRLAIAVCRSIENIIVVLGTPYPDRRMLLKRRDGVVEFVNLGAPVSADSLIKIIEAEFAKRKGSGLDLVFVWLGAVVDDKEVVEN